MKISFTLSKREQAAWEYMLDRMRSCFAGGPIEDTPEEVALFEDGSGLVAKLEGITRREA